ncbi:hypothetical protein AALB64_03455 [Lachnospiraceae bacterium 45-P1]
MCITVCEKLEPNEEGVRGYAGRMKAKFRKAGCTDDGNGFSNTFQGQKIFCPYNSNIKYAE